MPHVNISTPLGGTHTRFGIAFDEAVAMGASNKAISLESSFIVTNTSHAMTTTFIYQSNLVNDASARQGILEQVFSFSNTLQQASLCQNSTAFQVPSSGAFKSMPPNQIQQHS